MDIFLYSTISKMDERLVALEAAIEEIRRKLERLESRTPPTP